MGGEFLFAMHARPERSVVKDGRPKKRQALSILDGSFLSLAELLKSVRAPSQLTFNFTYKHVGLGWSPIDEKRFRVGVNHCAWIKRDESQSYEPPQR